MFYVYVLHSLEDHGLYIGFTTNLKKRIGEHEHGRRLQRNIADHGSSSITKLILIDMMPNGGNATSKAGAGFGSCVNN
jgi:predicted GIY-YIG superfamily endonuclease